MSKNALGMYTIIKRLFLITVFLSTSNYLKAQLVPSQERELATAAEKYKKAIALASQQKYSEAAVHMAEVLETTIQVLGKDHGAVAGKCLDLASILDQAGRFKEALPHYEESIRLNLDFFGENHEAIVETRRMYGVCLMNAGRPIEAKVTLSKATESAKIAYGAESLDCCRCLNDLGWCYTRCGDLDRGEDYYRQCLKIRINQPTCPPLALATSHNNLGDLLTKRGSYAEARLEFDKAIGVLRGAGDVPSRLCDANTYNNMGFLCRKQGDLENAMLWYDKALSTYREILPADHPSIARIAMNKGKLLWMQDRFEESLPNLLLALEIFVSANGADHPSVADVLSSISKLYFKAGEYRKSAEISERIVAIRSSTLGEEHRDTHFALYDIALADLYLGDFEEAEQNFARSVTGLKAVLDESDIELAGVQFGVGTFYSSQNNAKVALKHFDQAQKVIARNMQRVFPGLPQSEQVLYFDEINRGVNQSLSFALKFSDQQAVVDASVEWLANNKAIVQESVSRQVQLRNLAAKDNTTARDLGEIRQVISSLAVTKSTDAQLKDQQLAIKRLVDEESELTRKLLTELGIPIASRNWLTLAELRKAISSGSVLIDFARIAPSGFNAVKREYLVDMDHYVAWTIPPLGEGEVKLIDLGPAEKIDTMIRQIRHQIQSDGVEDGALESKGESLATIAINIELRKLSELVWSPIATQIGDTRTIVLCPDSNLWLLPWSALPIGSGEKVLIEQSALLFLVSSREIVNSKGTSNNSTPSVIFANPSFDCAKDKKMDSIEEILGQRPEFESDAFRGLSAISLLSRVPALPGTGHEASAIAPLLERMTEKKTQIYQQQFALESVFKEIKKPKVAVFATHGFFFPLQQTQDKSSPAFTHHDAGSGSVDIEGIPFENPFLRCGLLLAGCNNPEAAVRGDDGILTAMEIINIDLNGTELVVLSACDTGVGDTRNGESVVGVRQAFHLAGARSVVASLWQVPDRDTLLIMSRFFEKLAAGQSSSVALREAQLNLIQYRRSHFGGAHPLYWAAWTATN